MTEQHVNIAAKMYKARSSMKSLFGESYPDKVKVYMDIVKAVSKREGVGEIESAIKLIKDANEKHQDYSGILGVWILAATVELIEPSFKP
ncbi:hypothetical protein MUK70_11690 [Dyadobacter chenwenxiniae]|uniref:Uncharacterized protein n=1 Tax=Dyadobacter chenwenxiniae TaxID=2906456 RepID=A0A9X1PFT2_9BACT|nr:hypothetical protein [Dyadobacter chenwenxiniae]MCF0059903.1 hypothetical protein [Dyadobacter chenwenxiniae]UON85642.1 hypothetical protein MUK70_11690 [Dyadobacter chenwenxiniae]